MQINWVLLGVICLFLGGMIAIGMFASRKQKTAADFYVGGRKFNTLTITATQIASGFGGGLMIAHVGIGYQWGFSEFIYTGIALPIGVLALAMLVAGWLRKQDFYTTTDWMCHQYGESTSLRAITSITASLVSLGWWVAQPIAAGKVIAVLTGLPVEAGIILSAVVVIIYTMYGGIIAVAYTDVAQLGLMILALLIVLPMAISKAGGLQNIFATVPSENLGFFAAGNDVVWGWILAVLPAQLVVQTYHQRIYAAKSEKVARQGLYNLAISGVIAGIWASLLGMAIYTINSGLEDREFAMMWLVTDMLPEVMAVLVIAAIVAAIVSTADSALHTTSAGFTRDFYQSIFNPKATDAQILRFSKYCILTLGIIGVIIGLYFPDVLNALLMGYTLTTAGLLFPLYLGKFWKRINAAGAISGMLAGIITAIIFSLGLSDSLGIPAVAAGLVASFIATVGVSLVTKPSVVTQTLRN